MRTAPADMSDLFRKLGVGECGGSIVFDDAAPLATIRCCITEPRVPRSHNRSVPAVHLKRFGQREKKAIEP